MTTKLNPFEWKKFKASWSNGEFPISNLGETFCSVFDIDDPVLRRIATDTGKLEAYVMKNMPLGENLPDVINEDYEQCLSE